MNLLTGASLLALAKSIYYLRVRYRTPHTATQNIHKKKKLVEKERQQKKAKYTSIKQRKASKLSDNLYSVSSTEEAQS